MSRLLAVLPCGHAFCWQCIQCAFRLCSPRCPLCRAAAAELLRLELPPELRLQRGWIASALPRASRAACTAVLGSSPGPHWLPALQRGLQGWQAAHPGASAAVQQAWMPVPVQTGGQALLGRSSDAEEQEDEEEEEDADGFPVVCLHCLQPTGGDTMLLCDACNQPHHMQCLQPPLLHMPPGEWFCSDSCAQLRQMRPSAVDDDGGEDHGHGLANVSGDDDLGDSDYGDDDSDDSDYSNCSDDSDYSDDDFDSDSHSGRDDTDASESSANDHRAGHDGAAWEWICDARACEDAVARRHAALRTSRSSAGVPAAGSKRKRCSSPALAPGQAAELPLASRKRARDAVSAGAHDARST